MDSEDPRSSENDPLICTDAVEEARLTDIVGDGADEVMSESKEISGTRGSLEGIESSSGECRICHEDESSEKFEKPCACTGSMLFAHRSCIQRWIEEKGDTVCEVCHQNFQGEFEEPTPRPSPDDLEELPLPQPLGALFHSLRLQQAASAAAERYVADTEAQRQPQGFGLFTSNTQFSCLRSACMCFVAILLLRLLFNMTNTADNEEDPPFPAFVLIFVLRLLGPLVPFCLMYQAVLSLRRHHQAQENAMAAAEVANDYRSRVRCSTLKPPWNKNTIFGETSRSFPRK
ncbi:hypothetical protein CYMTET_39953 [Cymbomonas tetramitiformis]|uniref:RING-CH-type domain-containing protein n=1 Tax=Cymbomonas tetramitiformis TaxID=36881 RepID=A0AAE0CA34_9CHLO|nr:hypothetical protein CYMTET_39953 [Cymbomonas tetramitiformis]